MPDPMKPEFTAQNPIVAAAEKIRARREIGAAIDSVAGEAGARRAEDAEESLRAFAERLTAGCTLLNSIVGSAKVPSSSSSRSRCACGFASGINASRSTSTRSTN